MEIQLQNQIDQFFKLLEQKDIASWLKLWEDNATCSFPYANQLLQNTLKGKQEIKDFWSGSPDLYSSLSFEIKSTYFKEDTAVVFFQNNNAIKDTNEIYDDLSIGLFEFSPALKITAYTEFFDSINLGKTFKMIEVNYLDR